jgi:hypothetical protein
VALFLLVHWNSRISILGAAIAFALVGLALARRLERSYVRALETSLADQSKGMDPGEEESNGMTDSMIMPPGFLSGPRRWILVIRSSCNSIRLCSSYST